MTICFIFKFQIDTIAFGFRSEISASCDDLDLKLCAVSFIHLYDAEKFDSIMILPSHSNGVINDKMKNVSNTARQWKWLKISEYFYLTNGVLQSLTCVCTFASEY